MFCFWPLTTVFWPHFWSSQISSVSFSGNPWISSVSSQPSVHALQYSSCSLFCFIANLLLLLLLFLCCVLSSFFTLHGLYFFNYLTLLFLTNYFGLCFCIWRVVFLKKLIPSIFFLQSYVLIMVSSTQLLSHSFYFFWLVNYTLDWRWCVLYKLVTNSHLVLQSYTCSHIWWLIKSLKE